MSADNFYVVRRDPGDRIWVLTMGFESDGIDECKVPVSAIDRKYATKDEAIGAGLNDYTEYGVSTAAWCVDITGHVRECPLARRNH